MPCRFGLQRMDLTNVIVYVKYFALDVRSFFISNILCIYGLFEVRNRERFVCMDLEVRVQQYGEERALPNKE